MCGPGQVLRKIVVLENTAAAREAVVHYEMGSDPYHAATRSAHRRPAPGVAWDDWVIRVNGKEAARGSPLDLATRGRHRVKIPAALLKDGENTLDFGWAGTGREGGAAYFYLGIDTRTRAGRSASSANGRDFDSDLLRPAAPPKPEHQGEYMVRLLVGYAAEGAGAEAGDWPLVFADVFNRGGVLGVDFFEGNWVAKRGQWEVAGELKGQGAGALLMNTRPFRLPLRIEYECASDNPGDLSLQLNSPIDKPFCFVGFGSEYNTKNKIVTAAGEELAVSKTGLIEPGRVHTVVVEAAERSIRQLVDGTETAAAALAMPRRAVFFGFYVWNPGAIRGVKVYSPAGLEPDPPAATEPDGCCSMT